MSTITDNFNRTETPLAAPWRQADGSAGAWQANGTAAEPLNTGEDEHEIYDGTGAPAWGNDQSIKGKISVSAGTTGDQTGIGFFVRHHPTLKTGYRFVVNHNASGNCDLLKFVDGSATVQLDHFTQAFTDGQEWELRVVSDTLTMWLAGSLVRTKVDASSPIASGSPGLASSSIIALPGCTIDDVVMTDALGGPPVPGPTLRLTQSALRW